VNPEPDYWTGDFQLITALTQMPHLDVARELEKRKGAPFTELERAHLELRIRAAHYWVEHYATEEEKTRLQEVLPARAGSLTAAQRAFLHVLAGMLPQTKWEGEALQVCVFSAARLTPIDQPSAFKAIYRVLLDRENGPKGGNFLSFLERDFVVRRCLEVPVDTIQFWKESGVSTEAFEQWLAKEKPNLSAWSAVPRSEHGLGIIEVFATMTDGKTHCKRVLLSLDVPGEKEREQFHVQARPWVAELEARSGLKFGART
jgi:lysyl-tRNA synthetase class 1